MVYVLRGCFQHTTCRRKQESIEWKKIGLEQGGIRGKRVALGQALNIEQARYGRGVRAESDPEVYLSHVHSSRCPATRSPYCP